jgi:Protein of unknown function (DUF2971)
MPILTAAEMRVPRLYNYQPFCADWLRQILFDRKVHFSNPKNFNDPWDCRPAFNKSALDDGKIYEQHVVWFDRVSRRWGDFTTEEAHQKELTQLRCDRAFVESRIDQCSQTMAADISERYNVYCLTTHPRNTLMWSHYADRHKGICLEFNCRNLVFGGALRVEYCDTYPVFPIASDEYQDNLLPLITKAKAWAYEDEYRLIAQDAAIATDHHTLRTRNSFLKLPPDALRAVIMGCLIKPSDADEILTMIKSQVGRRVALKRIVRARDHYDLSIETVIC